MKLSASQLAALSDAAACSFIPHGHEKASVKILEWWQLVRIDVGRCIITEKGRAALPAARRAKLMVMRGGKR